MATLKPNPSKLGKYRVTWGPDGTATVYDVPIFQAVSRAGREYDKPWLNRAVLNFTNERAKGFRPAIHVGHCRDEFDERPACGLLDRLRVDGNRLYGTFDKVQPETFTSLLRGEWPYVSVEAWHERGKLKSLALLGSSPPQIKSEPLHVVSEYETFRDRGELVDRFFVRAFTRDAKRPVTGGVDSDLFQATKEGMMPMHTEEERAKNAAEGGDDKAPIKVSDMTTDDLAELIGEILQDKLDDLLEDEDEDEDEEGGEPSATPPAAPAAAPAGFSEGGQGAAEYKAVLDRFAEQITKQDAQIVRLVGEARGAKINTHLMQLRGEGYTWKQDVLDLFTDRLAGQEEAEWPATIAVLKNAGTREVVKASPLDFTPKAQQQSADSFREALDEKTKGAKSLADLARAASALMNERGV